MERIDLDVGLLTDTDKPDVAFGNHGFDFEVAFDWNDDHQLLRWCDHAAHGVNGQLLHRAIDRRAERSLLSLLFGLDKILAEFSARARTFFSASERSFRTWCSYPALV